LRDETRTISSPNLDVRGGAFEPIGNRLGEVFNDTKLISNLTRGTIVCERAWEADRPSSRMRGLFGRRMLAPGEGLLLQPAASIHTACMRFPIDVVFLDRAFQVVKVVDRLRPWRIAGATQARSALELAAGEAEVRGVSVGDRVAVLDRPIGSFEPLQPSDRNDGHRVGNCPGSDPGLRRGGDALEIERLYDHRGLVVVCENAATAAPGVRAPAKSSSIDELYQAIDHARPDRRRMS